MRQLLDELKKDILKQESKDLTVFGNRIDYMLQYWEKRINRTSQEKSRNFIKKQLSTYDRSFNDELSKIGFTVNFNLSSKISEVLEASIQENASIISDLSENYLKKVQQSVWSAVTNGYDLGTLKKELKKIDGITDKRAKRIAINQGAQAHAIIERERRKEAGITHAVWLHSHAGKKPRPSHVKANGVEFEIEKGLFLDGKWTLPGQEINCRCGSKVIINVDIGV